jgi:hypothetical protein
MAWLKYELVPSGKSINNCKVELRGNSVVENVQLFLIENVEVVDLIRV